MDEKQAWQCFEKTGSIEAYLLYHALDQKENFKGNDVQSQGDPSSDQSNSRG